MSDTLMAIIGIIVAVILMFIFPLVDFSGKNDEIAQTVAQVAVSEFVNTVATQGKITEFDYNQLVQKLYSTGNTYDIQIEVQILDDNPRRVTTTGSKYLLGEYKYYSVYTNTILEDIESEEKNNEYKLKKDDYIIVTVKNSNITLGTQFKNIFYKLMGQETSAIGTSSSAVVVNNAYSEVEPEEQLGDRKENEEEETYTIYITEKLNVEYKDAFNLVFISDVSNSMAKGTRYEDLSNSMTEMCNNIKGIAQTYSSITEGRINNKYEIASVIFGDNARVAESMTLSKDTTNNFVPYNITNIKNGSYLGECDTTKRYIYAMSGLNDKGEVITYKEPTYVMFSYKNQGIADDKPVIHNSSGTNPIEKTYSYNRVGITSKDVYNYLNGIDTEKISATDIVEGKENPAKINGNTTIYTTGLLVAKDWIEKNLNENYNPTYVIFFSDGGYSTARDEGEWIRQAAEELKNVKNKKEGNIVKGVYFIEYAWNYTESTKKNEEKYRAAINEIKSAGDHYLYDASETDSLEQVYNNILESIETQKGATFDSYTANENGKVNSKIQEAEDISITVKINGKDYGSTTINIKTEKLIEKNIIKKDGDEYAFQYKALMAYLYSKMKLPEIGSDDTVFLDITCFIEK